jgi:hypothetical protein
MNKFIKKQISVGAQWMEGRIWSQQTHLGWAVSRVGLQGGAVSGLWKVGPGWAHSGYYIRNATPELPASSVQKGCGPESQYGIQR